MIASIAIALAWPALFSDLIAAGWLWLPVGGFIAVAPDDEGARAMQQQLAEWYEEGSLEPRIHGVVAFDQVAQALTDLDERRVIGKQVIRVSE